MTKYVYFGAYGDFDGSVYKVVSRDKDTYTLLDERTGTTFIASSEEVSPCNINRQ